MSDPLLSSATDSAEGITTRREIAAMDEFHRFLPCDAPRKVLRAPIISVIQANPDAPYVDVLWTGTMIAGMVYLPMLFASRKAIPAASPLMFGFALGAMAGNVPELLTALGYDPLQLSRLGFLRIETRRHWYERQRCAQSKAEVMQRLQRLDGLLTPIVGRAHDDFSKWHDERAGAAFRRGDPNNSPTVIFKAIKSALGIANFVALDTAIPQFRAASAIRRGWGNVDPSEALNAWLVDFEDRDKRDRVLPVIVGDDRRLHVNAGSMLDAFRGQEQATNPTLRQQQVTWEATAASQRPPEPWEVMDAEERAELLRQARAVIRSVARDERDLADLDLIESEDAERAAGAARAEALDVSDRGLSKIERRLQGLALWQASGQLRELLLSLMSDADRHGTRRKRDAS